MKLGDLEISDIIAALVIALLLLILFITSTSHACDKNQIAYQGLCAADPRPAVVAVDYVKPSDEQPPKDKMPSYEREGIHADMPNSVAGADDIADRQKADAIIEGKKKAGIK